MLRLEPRAAALLESLDDPDALTVTDYYDVVMPKPYVDGAVILGDAAHAMSPQLDQGANLGLFDAMELENALATCSHLGDALVAYDRARRSHLAFYQPAPRVG